MTGRIYHRPTTLRFANDFVEQFHRHSIPTRGCRFCLAAWWDICGVPFLQGVVIVGRPVARGFDHETVAEVTRLCVSPLAVKGTPSHLYQAAKRVWQAMGGLKIVTYTLAKESGDSLRGAAWTPAADLAARDGWLNREGRLDQPVFEHEKIRWEKICE